MKATSLSVNVRSGCNATCPFCIASTTWKTGHEGNRHLRAGLGRALNYARYHKVDTVLITGSGEPTLKRDLIMRILDETNRVGVPITELQTNGLLLARDDTYLDELDELHLNTVALSVASVSAPRSAELMSVEMDYFALARQVSERGMLCRISLNLVDEDSDFLKANLADYVDELRACGVKQFTLRQLGIPEKFDETEKALAKVEWVKDKAMGLSDVEVLRDEIRMKGHLLRTLSYGASVYDYRGLSTCIATCMTETTREDEIRSLILQPDGHLYDSWNYKGSCLA